jgi:methyltransferase (TIGR00027 family)
LAAAEAGIRQYVIIGAGLDTRAFRLFEDYPDMSVIEIDHPDVFRYKEPILRRCGAVSTCRRNTIGLEYHEVAQWQSFAERDANFNCNSPTIFVVEGLSMYLTEDVEIDLYEKILSVSPVGSVVTGDALCGRRRMKAGIRDLVWYGTNREKLERVFAAGGFDNLSWTSVYADSANFPGGPVMPCVPSLDKYFLLHAEKRE